MPGSLRRMRRLGWEVSITVHDTNAIEFSRFSAIVTFPDGKKISVDNEKPVPCDWFPEHSFYIPLIQGKSLMNGHIKADESSSSFQVQLSVSNYVNGEIKVWARFVYDRLFK
jgi:hypothetical protein